ncbi:MAG: flagellar export chaperone FliS [Planctomycetes bacterium]|nr:flagellar export chaperone FliS [Planctomycetota bacterium]
MTSQHSQYLESKVLTAPPQRLHLMLIEGALRFGRQAEQELRAGNNAAATARLTRMLDIVGELLVGVRQTKSETNDKLATLYWFVFRRVSEAMINADAAALTEVMRILELERETWQTVCEKLAANGSTRATAPTPTHDFGAAHPAAPMTGLSLEA